MKSVIDWAKDNQEAALVAASVVVACCGLVVVMLCQYYFYGISKVVSTVYFLGVMAAGSGSICTIITLLVWLDPASIGRETRHD